MAAAGSVFRACCRTCAISVKNYGDRAPEASDRRIDSAPTGSTSPSPVKRGNRAACRGANPRRLRAETGRPTSPGQPANAHHWATSRSTQKRMRERRRIRVPERGGDLLHRQRGSREQMLRARLPLGLEQLAGAGAGACARSATTAGPRRPRPPPRRPEKPSAANSFSHCSAASFFAAASAW